MTLYNSTPASQGILKNLFLDGIFLNIKRIKKRGTDEIVPPGLPKENGGRSKRFIKFFFTGYRFKLNLFKKEVNFFKKVTRHGTTRRKEPWLSLGSFHLFLPTNGYSGHTVPNEGWSRP
jgi:hypothetical protein